MRACMAARVIAGHAWLQVCGEADKRVQLTAAKAWVTQPKSCLGGKRLAMLAFTLRDSHSEAGVQRVNLFLKQHLAEWFHRNKCALLTVSCRHGRHVERPLAVLAKRLPSTVLARHADGTCATAPLQAAGCYAAHHNWSASLRI